MQEFVVHSESFPLLQAAYILAKENGKNYSQSFNSFDYDHHKPSSAKQRRLWFQTNNEFKLSNEFEVYDTSKTLLTLPQDWNKFEELIKQSVKQDIKVQLNTNTEAIVTPKEIVIGCQTFQFQPIIDLWKAIHSPIPQQESKEEWIAIGVDSNGRPYLSGSGMHPTFYDSKQRAFNHYNNKDQYGIAKVEHLNSTIKIKLNESFSAKIDGKLVIVDSRIFTFEAVDSLYQAVQTQQS